MDSKELIRAMRNKKGMTRTEFARAAGVTYMSIYNWENGRSSPSWDMLTGVCQRLKFRIYIQEINERYMK